MYRIKLAEKQNYSASDFFSEVNMKNNLGVKKVLRRSALKREEFGKNQDETFNQYSAVTIDKLINSDNSLNNIIESSAKTLNKKIVKGNIYCGDAFYEKEYDYKERVKKLDVLGIEMETFALFSNARKFNKKATCLLTVSDLFFSEEKLSSLEREKELNDMIVLALESCLKL